MDLNVALRPGCTGVKTTTLEDIDLTLVLVEGELRLETFREFFATHGPRPTRDVIFLYHNVSSALSFEETRAFAEDAKDSGNQPGDRTCYVIDSNLAFGATRSFVSMANQEGATSRHVCRTLAEAAHWMSVDQDRITDEFNKLIDAP